MALRIGMTCYPSYGGSGVVASELGRQLARRGHKVHFITYDVPFRVSRFEEGMFFHEVEVPSYPLFKYPPYLLALANKMVEVARDEGLDILHVHYAIPHAASAVLARQVLEASGDVRTRPAVVTTLHGTDVTLVGNDPSFAELTAYSINASDGVTAVSEALRRRTVETFRPKVDVQVIPNFIDPADYPDRGTARSSPCRRCLAPHDELVVIHISNFRPVKRAELVVRVWAGAGQAVKRTRLILVGDGPDLPRARREAARLGVADRVVCLGRQERVEELLLCSDVLLLPSLEESFGLAALEAMAAGTPVVATRVGGLPEVVGDNEGGLLFEPDDVEGMTAGLRRLLEDDELRARLGAGGRERAFRLFASGIIVPRYENYYRAVLDRLSGRGSASAPKATEG